MGLRLRDDVFYVPVSDGLYFRGAEGTLLLRGTQLQAWFDRLSPHLRGQHTLDELCAAVPEEQRRMVRSILQPLIDQGFVRTSDPGNGTAGLSAVPVAYHEQVRMLGYYLDGPAAAFDSFRDCRLLVVGESAPALAVLRAGMESGVRRQHHHIVDGTRPYHRLDEYLELYREQDPELVVAEAPESPNKDWTQRLDRYDAVCAVASARHLGTMEGLARACRARGVPFLPAVVAGDEIFLGPYREAAGGCWNCLRSRLGDRLAGSDGADLSAPAAALAGGFLIFELFKARTGFRAPETRGRVCVLDQATLELHRHPLCAAVSCPDCRRDHTSAAGGRTTEQPIHAHEPPVDTRELLVRLARELNSEVTGVFAAVEEADLPQLPLSQCTATVRLPTGDRRVAECADNPLDARLRAVIAGLEAYFTAGLAPDRHEPEPGEMHEPEPGGVYAVGAGPGQAAVRGGLLALAAAARADAMPLTWRDWPAGLDAVPDLARYLRTLDLATAVEHAELGAVHLVRGRVADGTGVFGAGLDRTAALRRVIEKLIQHALAEPEPDPADPADPASPPRPASPVSPAEVTCGVPAAADIERIEAAVSGCGGRLSITTCAVPELAALPDLQIAYVTVDLPGSAQSVGSQGPAVPMTSRPPVAAVHGRR